MKDRKLYDHLNRYRKHLTKFTILSDRNSQQIGYIKNVHKHNKDHKWQTHSKEHTMMKVWKLFL